MRLDEVVPGRFVKVRDLSFVVLRIEDPSSNDAPARRVLLAPVDEKWWHGVESDLKPGDGREQPVMVNSDNRVSGSGGVGRVCEGCPGVRISVVTGPQMKIFRGRQPMKL